MQGIPLVFSSRCFIILRFVVKSVIPFEFLFVHGVSCGLNIFISLYMNVQFLKRLLFIQNYHYTLSKISCPCIWWVYFHAPCPVPLSWHLPVFIPITPCFDYHSYILSLKMWLLVSQLCAFCQSCFVYATSLHLHVSFISLAVTLCYIASCVT